MPIDTSNLLAVINLGDGYYAIYDDHVVELKLSLNKTQ